jgi:hypothetical protein
MLTFGKTRVRQGRLLCSPFVGVFCVPASSEQFRDRTDMLVSVLQGASSLQLKVGYEPSLTL